MRSWLRLRRDDPYSKANRERHDRKVSARLSEVLGSTTVEDADPEEVAARIRSFSTRNEPAEAGESTDLEETEDN